jgi:hypothetical protein
LNAVAAARRSHRSLQNSPSTRGLYTDSSPGLTLPINPIQGSVRESFSHAVSLSTRRPRTDSTHRDPVPVRLCTEVGSCGHVQASGVAPAASTVRTVHVSWHVSCCNSTALCSTQKLVPFNKRRAKAHDRDGLASALSQVARSAVTRASIAEVLKTPVWISLASPLRPARAPCWGVWFHVPASKLKERRLIASSPPLTALRRSRIETTTPALVEKCASPQAVC